jgi:hypothetical protein
MRQPAHTPGAGDAAALALLEGMPCDAPLGFGGRLELAAAEPSGTRVTVALPA